MKSAMKNVFLRETLPAAILSKQGACGLVVSEPFSHLQGHPCLSATLWLMAAPVCSWQVPPGPNEVFDLRGDTFSVETPFAVKG